MTRRGMSDQGMGDLRTGIIIAVIFYALAVYLDWAQGAPSVALTGRI